MGIASRRHPLLAAMLACLLVLLAAAPVGAHAELESATPGPDETVEGSPSELVASFTEDLGPNGTSIAVVDAGGAEVAAGGEPGDGPREWRLDLPDLSPGEFEVRWVARSSDDDHLERGTYTFTVVPAPTPTASTAPTAPASASASARTSETPTGSPPPTPSSSPGPATPAQPASDASVLVPIVAVLLLVGGLGAWLFRRRGT